jgi:DNA-binding transcriptional LysR family regulator
MNSELLRFFKVTAESGSITEAARRLNCVQPNVSARIKQLEENLDVKLFSRQSRGIKLTSEGETLLTYAEKILDLFHEAKIAIEKKNKYDQPLIIGATDIISATYLPFIISNYYENKPNLLLNTVSDTSEELVRRVLSFEINGAFINGDKLNSKLDAIEVVNDLPIIAASKGISPVNTHNTFYAFKNGCYYRRLLEHWLRSQNCHRSNIIEVSSIDNIYRNMMFRKGLTILPESAFQILNLEDYFALYNIPGIDNQVVPVFFIFHKNISSNSMITNFVSWLSGENIKTWPSLSTLLRPQKKILSKLKVWSSSDFKNFCQGYH